MLLAFTLIEVIVVFAILGGLVFLGVLVASKIWPSSTRGTFTTAPATISPLPATGTFVYTVTVDGKGKPSAKVHFELLDDTSHGTAIIKTITDGPNGPAAIDATSGDGETDQNGNITVVAGIEKSFSAKLKASDKKSGKSTPADDERTFSAP